VGSVGHMFTLGLRLAVCVSVSSVGFGQKPDAIPIHVLYETNCPYSQQFIIDTVGPLIGTKEAPGCLSEEVKFEWFAYGMATKRPDGGFNCQHGEDECKGNRIQLCAKKKLGDTRKLSRFIICHETNIRDKQMPAGDIASVQPCADLIGMSEVAQELITCSTGSNSLQLAADAGMQTDLSHPPLVPFAFFEGDEMTEGYNLFGQDLTANICSQLTEKGKPVPACCAAATGRRLSEDQPNLI